MNKVKTLRNPELRDKADQDHPAGMHDIEDAALSSITGGCSTPCGGSPTSRFASCVPPGDGCP